MTKTGQSPADKQAASKELKKQESQEEIPEEPVSPPPRMVAMLLDAYPEKMIEIREQIDREEEERRLEMEKQMMEEEKKKQSKLQDSQIANTKSSQENKSQVQEDAKKKRKDSLDIKHLENQELHFCYTQNKNVLTIDADQCYDELDCMMMDNYMNGTHVSFWVYFEAIKYEHPSSFSLTRKPHHFPIVRQECSQPISHLFAGEGRNEGKGQKRQGSQRCQAQHGGYLCGQRQQQGWKDRHQLLHRSK